MSFGSILSTIFFYFLAQKCASLWGSPYTILSKKIVIYPSTLKSHFYLNNVRHEFLWLCFRCYTLPLQKRTASLNNQKLYTAALKKKKKVVCLKKIGLGKERIYFLNCSKTIYQFKNVLNVLKMPLP